MAVLRNVAVFCLVASLLLLTSGCHMYNKYVRQGFPISDEDEVVRLVTRVDIDVSDSTDKIEDVGPVTVQRRSYTVGDSAVVEGYHVPQPLVIKDLVVVMDRLGVLHAVSKSDPNEVRWKVKVDMGNEDRVTHSSLASAGGRVFVSVGLDFVEAYNLADGKRLWRASIVGSARGDILVDKDDRIFVLTNENRVYALHQSDGSLAWMSNAFTVPFKLVSSPAATLFDNKVVVAMPNRIMLFFNKDNGFVIRQLSIDKLVQTYDDFLCDVTISPVVISRDNAVLLSVYNEDLRLVGNDGSVAWSLPIYTNFAPVFKDDLMFVLSQGNVLYAVQYASGKIIWKNRLATPYQPKFSVQSVPDKLFGPVMYKGELVVFSKSGNAMRFNPYNGAVRGEFKTQSGLQGVPKVHDGWIYVYTSKKSTLEMLRY